MCVEECELLYACIPGKELNLDAGIHHSGRGQAGDGDLEQVPPHHGEQRQKVLCVRPLVGVEQTPRQAAAAVVAAASTAAAAAAAARVELLELERQGERARPLRRHIEPD